MVVLGAAVVALDVLWTYRQLSGAARRDRALLLAARIAMVVLVLFALLRPMLLLKRAVPQQNFVGVLVDDSRSMKIADEQSKPRSEYVKDQVGRTDGPMLTELGKPHVFHRYAGCHHGFLNRFTGRPGHYDGSAAADSWAKAMRFLAQHLGAPAAVG